MLEGLLCWGGLAQMPRFSSKSVRACMLSCFSRVRLSATLWTIACEAPLSMGFSRQEHWSGLPCPPSRKESSPPKDQIQVSCGRFFTTEPPGKPPPPRKGPPKNPKWHHCYKCTSFFWHCSDQRPSPFQLWTAETLLGWLEKIQPVGARTSPSESWGCLGYAPELHRYSSWGRPVINVSWWLPARKSLHSSQGSENTSLTADS